MNSAFGQTFVGTQHVEFMIRYLLGELSDSDAARFEEQYLADRNLFEELAAVETDLIDSYVHAGLQPERRARCEERFLISDILRAKVENAKLLARKASPPRVARNLAVWASMAAAIVLMVGSVLLTTRRTDRTQPATLRVPMVVAFALTSGLERGPGHEQTIAVPGAADVVRLQVEMESKRYPAVDAVVEKAEGAKVWSKAGAVVDGAMLALDVPTGILHDGVYILTIQSGGATVAEYSFRIRSSGSGR